MISADQPFAADQTIPHAGGKWLLLISLGVVFFVLLTLYASVLGVLLPNQIQNIDPLHKAQTLGIVYAITSVFSTIATPVAGAFSDRTRTRLGRRTPWILFGSLIGGVALMLVPSTNNLVIITFFWVIATITLNSMQPAITTIVADRFSSSERGTASGVVGAAMTAGVSSGTIYGGLMAEHLVIAYAVIGAAIILVCFAFVLLNPEPKTPLKPPAPFRLGAFLRSFWVDPRVHPDFGWAFLGRFTIYMGYTAVLTYLLYILEDHIGLTQANANHMIARLSSVTFVALATSGLLSGWLSDRLGRRKPLVFLSGLMMAAAVTAPLVSPTISGMYVYAVLIGLGYGAFMSVDLALMTQVLPVREVGDEAVGKDLGILTTAINIPQILAPVLAAWVLTMTGNNYPLLFVLAAGFVVAGAFFVLPIRSVR
ncbi:MAG: MFS transporter [Rhizomicrobium sp.]